MSKLLIISTDRKMFEPGSPVRERQIAYAKSWDELHVIVLDTEDRPVERFSNCFLYSTKSRSKWLYPFDAAKLAELIIKEKGITNITCQDPFLTGLAGAKAKKKCGIPLEISIHTDIGSPNFASNPGNLVRKVMASRILKKADKIRVVSQKIKQYALKLGISEVRIEVRPIAIDENFYRNAPIITDLKKKYPQFSQVTLMASRIEPEKDIGLAVMAWPRVLEHNSQAGLIIVGEGSQKEKLAKLIKNKGLEKSVILESWADRPMLASYYKTADVFLNTSLFEGYGMTLMEAKAAGCKKIVSTDVGIAREAGARIIGWNEESLAQAIVNDKP